MWRFNPNFDNLTFSNPLAGISMPSMDFFKGVEDGEFKPKKEKKQLNSKKLEVSMGNSPLPIFTNFRIRIFKTNSEIRSWRIRSFVKNSNFPKLTKVWLKINSFFRTSELGLLVLTSNFSNLAKLIKIRKFPNLKKNIKNCKYA